MRRAKSKEQILESPYVNKREIRVLLGVSQSVSQKIHATAKQIDTDELGDEWMSDSDKVRLETVLRVCGVNKESIARTVSNEE